MSETILFHPENLTTTDVQATTLWGRAFDWLLVKRNWSLGQFSQRIGKQRNEVRYWRVGKGSVGPGIGVINEILPKIGSSWVEWAGIVTQLNILDDPKGKIIGQVESELATHSPEENWVDIPKGITVHSRMENGCWVAWMKAFPQWKIIRASKVEAEAAMQVLAVQIIRLARSFGVVRNESIAATKGH